MNHSGQSAEAETSSFHGFFSLAALLILDQGKQIAIAAFVKPSFAGIGGAVLTIGMLLSPAGHAGINLETKTKAAYLYHLTQFVEWPNLPQEIIRISVVGKDPVGGVIGFYSEGGKIKLEINPAAARNANLKISAKLMEVSRTALSP